MLEDRRNQRVFDVDALAIVSAGSPLYSADAPRRPGCLAVTVALLSERTLLS